MTDQFDDETGEIIPAGQALTSIDSAALATLARVEIDQQIATARAYPRSIDRAVKNITALATLDEETAEECCYALVRKGRQRGGPGGEENRPIEGPSVRLAEIAAQQWGNNRSGANVVEVNRKEKYVAAEGFFLDLETNAATKMTVRRRISTKSGGIFSDDMIIVTGNAACAIAKRNAILAGIPRGVYRPAYHRAREIIAGTAETLSVNRAKAIDAFKHFGVTPEQIFDALNVEGEGDIKPSHIATLRAMFSTLRNKESTVEEMFGKPEPDHKIVTNALADDPAEDPNPAAQQGGATAQQNAKTVAREATSITQVAEDDISGNGDSGDSSSAADPDAVNSWFAAGAKAARDGMSRKALPPELRSPDRADDAAAWFDGFDSVKNGGAA